MLKNITFSVEESEIKKARELAKKQDTTLNELVRTWIHSYADESARRARIQKVFDDSKDLDLSGPKLTRDEMNARR